MAEQNVLREYLISLGFKVNEQQEKKFATGLSSMDKAATNLGRSLVGVASAAVAMTTEFAFRMEKLYYSSRLAQSAAGNLQALDFGGKQAGVKDFTANVMSLARSIRANPGIQGLVNSLGVQVSGRDMGDVALDIVDAMKHMPPFVRERYGALFGWSPDDIQLMVEGIDKIREASELRKRAAAEIGLDTEAANKAGLEYAQQWREVLMVVGLVRDSLSLMMVGPMKELAETTKDMLKDWAKLVKERERVEQTAGKITPESAKASGLSVGEQQEVAKRASQQKTWSQLTPDEREARGMPRDDGGQPWTVWDYLTPAERKEKSLPATEDEMSWDERWNRRAKASFRRFWSGGAELTRSAKERIGQDGLRQQNPGAVGKGWNWALDKLGYQSVPKTAFDPAALDAATEPSVRAGDGVPQGPAVPPTTRPVPQSELARHPQEQEYLRQQEQQRGLSTGLLDYIWKTESGRGQAMRSPAGAKGHFGFMDGTAAQYGLKNPDDFAESAKAAASYMSDLLKKYGDMKFALAAYNWGPGKVDKLLGKTMAEHGDWSQEQVDQHVLGLLPKETRKYVAGYEGDEGGGGDTNISVKVDSKIDVSGANGDPRAIAAAVAAHEKATFSNIARDFAPKVR